MHQFRYEGSNLFCEDVAVESLVEKHGTPLYVYSQRTITDHFQRLDKSLDHLDHLICYAVKANSNLAILRTLANLGSGFDIVSEGELRRVIAAGGDSKKCVFAGVGKTEEEIEFALKKGILAFNAESEPELQRINKVAARLKKTAPVSIRVNPNVDAGTHAKISTGTYEHKFGIAYDQIGGIYERASKLKNLQLRGVQMHIGSQLTEVAPFEKAVKKLVPIVQQFKERYDIEFFSIGGGIGIMYKQALESGPSKWWLQDSAKGLLTPAKYAETLVPLLKPLGVKILLEPGRFIVGNAGILVTRVEYVKKTGSKNFVIVDAAMNDLIRPAFYDAYHEIVPLKKGSRSSAALVSSDVVGPICESGDFFCKDRPLPAVQEGDYIALLSAGAYASVMGSNYNARPFPPEILVNGATAEVVRKRQAVDEIWANEKVPASLK